MNKEIFGKDYLLIELCGEGSFAEVFKVQSKSTGKYYAIKRLKQRYRSLDQVSHINEIVILRSIGQHPNIIKLEDVLYNSENGSVALVFEYMEHNLYELLSGKVKSQIDCHNCKHIESVTLIIIYQVFKALAHLHSNYLFHRDIKPENILINPETLEIKLIDFGSARLSSIRGPFTDYITTRWYRAPECILTSGFYGPSVDIWAVGCILFEIMSGRPLFPGKNEIDQITKINQVIGTPSSETLAQFANNPSQSASFSSFNFNFQKRQPLNLSILLQTTNTDLVDLMKSTLEYNPIDRISASSALEHPVFMDIRNFESEWQKHYEIENTIPMPKYVLGRIIKEISDPNFLNDNQDSNNYSLSKNKKCLDNNNRNLHQTHYPINHENNNLNNKNINRHNLINNSNNKDFINLNDTGINNSNVNDENTENNSLKDSKTTFIADKGNNHQLQSSTNATSSNQPENNASKKKYNLIEARRRAAQRIRNYQARNNALSKMKEQDQKKRSLPYNFGRMTENINYSQPTHKFTRNQKHGPDIIVPHNIIIKKM